MCCRAIVAAHTRINFWYQMINLRALLCEASSCLVPFQCNSVTTLTSCRAESYPLFCCCCCCCCCCCFPMAPSKGLGLFVEGEVPPGALVALFPGLAYSKDVHRCVDDAIAKVRSAVCCQANTQVAVGPQVCGSVTQQCHGWDTAVQCLWTHSHNAPH
jgi:hypothetical protein